jgi:hypothetical protein
MNLQDRLVRDHRKLLSKFDKRHLKSWEDQFTDNPEAALCEASIRDIMQGFGYEVEPVADLKGQGDKGAVQRPDFRCSKGDDAFYVEVANISIAKATELTNLPHPMQLGKFSAYGKLTKAVFGKATGKATQCEQELPTLLAVGTFHSAASYVAMDRFCANCLLTGEPLITWDVDFRAGASLGNTYQTTRLKYASFIKPGECSIIKARTSISGILLCGFGALPASIIGVLHPNADKPFMPELLPRIPFGKLQIDFAKQLLSPVWPDN